MLYDKSMMNFNYMWLFISFDQINYFLFNKLLVKAYFVDKFHAVTNERLPNKKLPFICSRRLAQRAKHAMEMFMPNTRYSLNLCLAYIIPR